MGEGPVTLQGPGWGALIPQWATGPRVLVLFPLEVQRRVKLSDSLHCILRDGAHPLGRCPALVLWKAVPSGEAGWGSTQWSQWVLCWDVGPSLGRGPWAGGLPVPGSGFREAPDHGDKPTPEQVCEDPPMAEGAQPSPFATRGRFVLHEEWATWGLSLGVCGW